ncbi:MAG: hypothetical protein CMQ88_03905 [Gammaproteobacteria bacterium]|nr:hypothetical protein [Gammaproteobacteria bacterium]
MKTTKQDSKMKQENEATVSDKTARQLEHKESPQQVSTSGAEVMPVDTEQLAFELLVAESLATVAKDKPESKKRKDKDDKDEDVKAKKEAIDANDQSSSGEQVNNEVATEDKTPEKESDIAKALAEQAESAESNAGASGLSITTVVLSALGFLGAGSYYKNSNKDSAPEFTSGAVANDIAENSGAGQAVYTAVAVDDAAENAVVTYSLSAESDNGLSINSTTGVVTLATNPDHEVKSQYNFTVIAADAAGNQSQQAVKLVITDLDEAAPNITSSVAVEVSENSGVNQVVYTAAANDNGDITDGVITYSLSSDSDSSLSINSVTGEVVLADNPDHEVKTSYGFTLIATDSVGNASQQSVVLNIRDLDEVAPTVTSDETADAIDENSGSNQVVYIATADDSLDVSEGVSFSLSSGSDAALTINSDTGEVTLSENPDHEAQSQYAFGVIATDAAGNVSETQSVIIDINDIDDTAPTITSGDTAQAIDENSGANQVIYTAVADDSADVSDGFSFSLLEGSDSALSINESSGEVTLSTDPDQETQQQYSFTVVATDEAGNSSQKQVTLNINDLDEVAPLINSGATAGVVENTGANQVIYTATADDSADISDGFTFALSDDSDAGLTIDQSTGEVTLLEDPDEETKAQYSFTVIAQDVAGNQSEQSVTLSVGDVDEVAPLITSDAVADSVDENTGSGQIVYTVTADDTADISVGVTFSLSADSDPALSINATTGQVMLNQDPDHETQAQYSFGVIATDFAGNTSEVKSVTLNINDLDDAAPVITSGETATAINENSNEALNVSIYTAQATDLLDDVSKEPISFSLAEGSDPALSIDAASGVVSLNENPDHETQTQYSFTVIATDGAGNASEGKLVTLDITDIDDVAPLITSASTISIIENSGAQVIYRVESIDEGDDVVTDTNYALVDTGGLDLSIDQVTGEVTLATNLDADATAEGVTTSEYTFVVLATNDPDLAVDGNGVVTESPDPQLGSVVKVRLNVVDIDDTAPVITSEDTAAAVDENSNSTGTKVIYTASASDTDYPFTGPEITYSLSNDSDAGLSIDPNTGEVTLLDNPDHETKDQYSFTLFATDGAGNVSEGKLVTLDINDVDDADPVITSADTAPTIDENSGEGQIIYTVVADDSLDISAEPILYSLSTDSNPALNINSETGAVTLAENPDYETAGVYNFTVIATDNAGNSAEKVVTLDINDLDDTAPEITSLAIGDFDETLDSGSVVFTVTSDDAGATYSLKEGSDSALEIDAASGQVTINEDPDFAVKSEYSFTVIASDGANNASEQEVTLTVNNIDEVAPLIISVDQATVIEGVGVFQPVYQTLVDDSADVSGGVTYEITNLAEFTINSQTGVVTLMNNPDAETIASYTFTVIATDAAGNSAEKEVTLTVGNIDDSAPVFSSSNTGIIDENIGSGKSIYTAIATDESIVNYELIDGTDPALSIESLTGVVSLNENSDFELKSSYTFTVRATDTADEPLSSVQEVTILVNNLDEIAPTITSATTVDSVDENSGSGQVIYTVIANDLGDISEGFAYSLSEDSDSALSIDSSTGDVTLVSNPDQEKQDIYTFTVIATDAAGNASEQELTLNINDLDEVAPTITSDVVANSVEENSGSNQVVYTATVDDSADVSAQPISFSLAESSDAGLTIDETTGEVTLTDNPVYANKNAYSFTVIAADGAGNSSEGKSVTLSVNEAAPEPASIALVNDSGASAEDNISSDGLVQVNGILPGTTWQYSLDYVDANNATWINGADSSFTISPLEGEGTFSVNVRVINDSNGRATDMLNPVAITIDTVAPVVELISADSDVGVVVIKYSAYWIAS